MLMPPGHDQPECGSLRHRFLEQLLPRPNSKSCPGREKALVGQGWPVVKHRHFKVQFPSQRRHRLRDMTRRIKAGDTVLLYDFKQKHDSVLRDKVGGYDGRIVNANWVEVNAE